jgi:aminoglycoside phosphotransferase (APT) family kinase protein
MGMDCSGGEFYFYHADLGPSNVLIELPSGVVNVIDWETAGYVPREWIMTKFRFCGGLDFNKEDGVAETYDWRVRVSRQLGKKGFPDVAESYVEWRNKSR